MRLILAGCEYAGTTTLANKVCEWIESEMGGFTGVPDAYKVHDHFKLPHVSHPPDLTEEEQRQLLSLSPRLKEMVQRHNIYYHLPTSSWPLDYIVIGLHIEDKVYGPLYFGYGADLDPEDPIMVTRGRFERWIMEAAPDIVLVLVKASLEAIARRMRECPHRNGVLREEDIEYVVKRFNEEYNRSSICNKMTIDTTVATVEESLREFVEKVDKFLTSTDRKRIGQRGE